MTLTLEAEQRLQRVRLTDFYERDKERWNGLAKQTRQFLLVSLNGAVVRPDDVAKALVHLVEVDKPLIDFLNGKKLRQKYWMRDFCDLILDRVWGIIVGEIVSEP